MVRVTHLLDTNVCIALMRGKPAAPRRHFGEPGMVAAISAIVLFELNLGVEKSQYPDIEEARINLLLSRMPVIPFEAGDARATAAVLVALGRIGQQIGAYDTLIAGQAIARDLVMVSGNRREFSRVPRLRLENWLD